MKKRLRISDPLLPSKPTDGNYKSPCVVCNRRMTSGEMVKNVFIHKPNFKEMVLVHTRCARGGHHGS